ncbi:Ribosomal protein S18 acetylase RimI [Arthrobacter sp. yr096]|uniref:GNAT family N-acetyltransferase n=1 Tax=Arthrobacter sp. yr096 TaxID=1761750 RepID=UPI0008CCBAD1|nr:GNAT family N-acetyltransferase [Arthrobacter sp. yr096]SEJ47361.1 Ribosomal protein S18 acetylase RimI [Arthrobacter sp. yr096]
MDFTLRPATVDDAEAMALMHVQSWKESYGRLLPPEFFEKQEAALPHRIERYRDFIAAGHTRLLAHDSEGHLVGLGAAGPGQDEDSPCERELFMLYTLERIHGRGVGQALVDALIGDGPAYLWVLDDNPRAQAFYRRNGFAPDGKRQLCDPSWFSLPEHRMVRP